MTKTKAYPIILQRDYFSLRIGEKKLPRSLRMLSFFRPNSAQWIRYRNQVPAYIPATRPLIHVRAWPQCRFTSSGAVPRGLHHTALYDLHIANQATMVPFAGYSMPVQYADLSIGDSHRWTRERASLFDVGHMVQHRLQGSGAVALLELITPASPSTLPLDHSTLSCLLHEKTGGIVDDTVITRLGHDHFHLVTNAACRQKDLWYLDEQVRRIQALHPSLQWDLLNEQSLIALQGPLSAEIVRLALPPLDAKSLDLQTFYFGQHRSWTIALPNHPHATTLVHATRGGYTGEDGFELSIESKFILEITRHILETAGPERLRLAGLGARDSLRLEAGMCLYGHDLDDNTTPVEAGLSWIVHRDRRDTGGFHGAETILRQLKPAAEGGGPPRRRVGLIVEGAPAREGCEIFPSGDDLHPAIGSVTSGCPSPTLRKHIAMGYVESGYHKSGTDLGVVVRGKRRKAVVTKMPFVASRYWRLGTKEGKTGGFAPG